MKSLKEQLRERHQAGGGPGRRELADASGGSEGLAQGALNGAACKAVVLEQIF